MYYKNRETKDSITRILDESWDFKNANTKEYTHCFHTYPAMMIPQIARRLIETYGQSAELLFDPYCGTGTSLVEANIAGIKAIGTDINPLARLIAKTKTTKIDKEILIIEINKFNDFSFQVNFSQNFDEIKLPNIKNIDYWFSKENQKKLAIILGYIDTIKNVDIKDFFKVAFSETVREVSFIKNGEFKLVRDKKFYNKSNLDVFEIMISKLERNKNGLIEFMNKVKDSVYSKVYGFNTVIEIPANILQKESVDLVITSPPYGDSRTTVAYGQYSRFSNEWLGFTEAQQLDSQLMGGVKSKQIKKFASNILNDIISTIISKDENRAKEVVAFFNDYETSIDNISKVVKKGGYICYVVGNRTVKGVNIPTDYITVDFFKNNNFIHLETIVRNIPSKRMPYKNSPSNIVGEVLPTMKNEYIVICKKV